MEETLKKILAELKEQTGLMRAMGGPKGVAKASGKAKGTKRTPEDRKEAKELKEHWMGQYKRKHGIEPTWAAAQSTMAYSFLSKLTIDEFKDISEYYLNIYPDRYVMRSKHPFALLLKNLDAVRVEWHNHLRRNAGHKKLTEDEIDNLING